VAGKCRGDIPQQPVRDCQRASPGAAA